MSQAEQRRFARSPVVSESQPRADGIQTMSTKKAKSINLTSLVCRRTICSVRNERSVSHYVSENEYLIEQFLAIPSYGVLVWIAAWAEDRPLWIDRELGDPKSAVYVNLGEWPICINTHLGPLMRVVARNQSCPSGTACTYPGFMTGPVLQIRNTTRANGRLRHVDSLMPAWKIYGGSSPKVLLRAGIKRPSLYCGQPQNAGSNEKQETRLNPQESVIRINCADLLNTEWDVPCLPAYKQGHLEDVVRVALDRKVNEYPTNSGIYEGLSHGRQRPSRYAKGKG